MELVCGISLLCKGSEDDKIQAVFKVFDENDDGRLKGPQGPRIGVKVMEMDGIPLESKRIPCVFHGFSMGFPYFSMVFQWFF